MSKKKKEHILFDQMLKQKKSIPISKINREVRICYNVSWKYIHKGEEK